MMLKFFNSVNKLHKNMRVCFNLNYHNNIRGHLGYNMLLFMFVAVHTWHHILQNVLLCHLNWVWCTKKQRRQFLHFFYWKDAKYAY